MTAISAHPPPTLERAATDHELVAASLSRPEAFADLFERHGREIHRYLSRRVGALADDLLSEVFLTAFHRRAAYRPERADVRPWLYGIASNLVRRHQRAEVTRYQALARTTVADEPTDGWDDTDDRVDAARLRPRLAGALAALDDRDREVLLLVAWGDLAYAEVAAVLGIPLGTVRSRLHRARRLLRQRLTDLDLTLTPQEPS